MDFSLRNLHPKLPESLHHYDEDKNPEDEAKILDLMKSNYTKSRIGGPNTLGNEKENEY